MVQTNTKTELTAYPDGSVSTKTEVLGIMIMFPYISE